MKISGRKVVRFADADRLLLTDVSPKFLTNRQRMKWQQLFARIPEAHRSDPLLTTLLWAHILINDSAFKKWIVQERAKIHGTFEAMSLRRRERIEQSLEAADYCTATIVRHLAIHPL